MRALSTFEGVGRSLDPAFSLVAIAKPYLLPLMTSSGSGSNDLFNELGRQVGALSSRAAAFPRRLDESLERLELKISLLQAFQTFIQAPREGSSPAAEGPDLTAEFVE